MSLLSESIIYSDYWKAYDGLTDYGAKEHFRVKHLKSKFANGKNHINAIVNFWGYSKHRLSKFKGIKRDNFLLHFSIVVLKGAKKNVNLGSITRKISIKFY